MIRENIEKELHAHIRTLEEAVKQSAPLIAELGEQLVSCFKRGNKLLLCGVGGAAADAQHVAAGFIHRFSFLSTGAARHRADVGM